MLRSCLCIIEREDCVSEIFSWPPENNIYIFYQVLCMGLMFLIDTTFAVVCHLSASIEGL